MASKKQYGKQAELLIIDDPDRPRRTVHVCRDCRKPVFVERVMDNQNQEAQQAARLRNARAEHAITCEATNATAHLLSRQHVMPTRSLGQIVARWRR